MKNKETNKLEFKNKDEILEGALKVLLNRDYTDKYIGGILWSYFYFLRNIKMNNKTKTIFEERELNRWNDILQEATNISKNLVCLHKFHLINITENDLKNKNMLISHGFPDNIINANFTALFVCEHCGGIKRVPIKELDAPRKEKGMDEEPLKKIFRKMK